MTTDGGTVTADGIWSVHQRPRSIRAGDQTFVGWIDRATTIGVTAYDHTTGETTDHVVGYVSTNDDHSNPSIFVRDDDRLVMFWVDRDVDDTVMFWSISDNPLDASSWGSVQSFDAGVQIDYPQPIEYNGNLRLYYRVGGLGPTWKFRESTDSAATFGAEQDFVALDDQPIYLHPYPDKTQANDRIHFALGDHRMSNSQIRHWYLEDGDYYESDGTLIQSESSELTAVNDLSLVYDGTASGNNPAKQYDLICDSNGNPHVAFTEHVETGSGGGTGDYRARWAKWDGAQWVVGSEITEMGGSLPDNHYYEGGLGLDSQDPTTVYVSVETTNRNYQIQEWTTNDDGSTWSKVADRSPGDATLSDPTKRGRPISPRGHQDDLNCLWWAGRYGDYSTDYNTQIRSDQL